MLTRSGALVLPGNDAAPALRDIARGLGRLPRFAGQTRGWWSVLHHVAFVDYLAYTSYLKDYNTAGEPAPSLRLWALLHDAHEAVTGDIPTPWKRAETRADQRRLDERIYRRLGVEFPGPWTRYRVHEADQAALVLEAAILGPGGFFDAEPDLLVVYERERTPERLAFVRRLRDRYPMESTATDNGRLVVEYELLVKAAVRACSR